MFGQWVWQPGQRAGSPTLHLIHHFHLNEGWQTFSKASASQIIFFGANCTSVLRLKQSHQLCSSHHQSVQKYPSLYLAAMVPSQFRHANCSKTVPFSRQVLEQVLD